MLVGVGFCCWLLTIGVGAVVVVWDLVVVGCFLWVGCLGLLATVGVVVGLIFGTWGIGLGFVLVVTSGCSCGWVLATDLGLGLVRNGSIRLVVGGLPLVGQSLVVVGIGWCCCVSFESGLFCFSLWFTSAFNTNCGSESVVPLVSSIFLSFKSLVPVVVVFRLACAVVIISNRLGCSFFIAFLGGLFDFPHSLDSNREKSVLQDLP